VSAAHRWHTQLGGTPIRGLHRTIVGGCVLAAWSAAAQPCLVSSLTYGQEKGPAPFSSAQLEKGPSSRETQRFLIDLVDVCGSRSGSDDLLPGKWKRVVAIAFSKRGELMVNSTFQNWTLANDLVEWERQSAEAPLRLLSPTIELKNKGILLRCTSGRCVKNWKREQRWSRTAPPKDPGDPREGTTPEMTDSYELNFERMDCAERASRALAHLIRLEGGRPPLF